jgi:hypothetical protein
MFLIYYATQLKTVFKKRRCLVASLSPQMPGFNPRKGYLGFVVDKVAMGDVLSNSDFTSLNHEALMETNVS